jgi:histidinol-phosphate/aromatic aminotransferase/cobyric acid decarboxylase-like protein/choline kinase
MEKKMQGLILAAGMGKRLGKHTQDQTKCMVKVREKALIEYTLEALSAAGISRVVIVTGYHGAKLKKFLGPTFAGMDLIYVDNEIYDRTNNIYSLWLAHKYLTKEDTLVLESDLIFEKRVLADVVQNPAPNLAVVAKYEPWMDGTVTLLDENDRILNFIPKKYFDWAQTGSYYKTVNIYKFSKGFSKNCYLPFLSAYVATMGRNEYYEQVLRVITYLENSDLKAHKLTSEKWYEIDDLQDLDIAEMLFAEGAAGLELYQKRYGGYWRFPKLKDFCYLVNPYFPTPRMLDELRASFESLITQYPSGLNIQNLLAAKMFGCDSGEILTGNGAAEIIKGLAPVLPGKIGVIFPTFNEYPERFGEERIKAMIPANPDFRYSLAELKEFATGIDALLLINPDNPSGSFLSRGQLLELLEFLSRKGIRLILDESFADFADKARHFTLIDSTILQKYTNLIVIKSISKSYGIPGLRLGVMACGDSALLAQVRRELAIWNINSLGEYFMQIFGKYKSDYEKACQLIAVERNRFYKALSGIGFIRVIPSEANYFLIEVINRFTSRELTELLLSRYQILIKDCSGKKAFEGRNYVRIAIRDLEDNDYLIEKLREIEIMMDHATPQNGQLPVNSIIGA